MKPRLQLSSTVQHCLHKIFWEISSSLLLVESLHTNRAAPWALWCNLRIFNSRWNTYFNGNIEADLHGRYQAVHVVPSVTVITEQQLVVILAGATQRAGLALDALPGVLLHADHHVGRELQTSWVTWRRRQWWPTPCLTYNIHTWSTALWTSNEFLSCPCFLVVIRISQAEITVTRGLCSSLGYGVVSISATSRFHF